MSFWNRKNKFPYTDNHDANLDYMMTVFENIKDEWHDLYVDLVGWKGTTTLELNTWKTNALAQIDQYETDFRAEIAVWKATTEQDIGVWEQSVLADLGTWRANFETLFATTFSNLTQIKTDAEAARDAAALSATAAAGSAEDAETSAESVSEALTQIATNAEDISDLKTQLNTEIGYTETVTPEPSFTDGYAIMTAGSQTGTIVESATNSVTDKIFVNAKTIRAYYTGANNPYGAIFCYNENDAYLYQKNFDTDESDIAIPDNTAYLRYYCMTTRKDAVHVEVDEEVPGKVYDEIGKKLNANIGTENAGKILSVNDDGDIIATTPEKNNNDIVYMLSHPQKPLFAEMCADFAWCSMVIPAAFTGKNVILTVSGTAGDSEVTASAISPNTLNISDCGSDWIGGVLSADGVNYTVCNFRLVSGNTLEVFPALESNITNGTLSTLMYDSGASYVGLHLTENGYKAYMQNLYAKNPKHCEVGKYVARFRADVDNVSPFTWYGQNIINGDAYRFISENRRDNWLQAPAKNMCAYRMLSTSTRTYEQKMGAYWDVDLKGESGYLEAFVFAFAPNIELPTGQELHVVVTIDGVEKLNKTISDSVCKRIIVDYENANSGRIEIYSDKWAKIDSSLYGFGIGRVTWWVNELSFDDDIFPVGSVIAQEFDSWGVFHDGASGKELERLHNSASGITVPFTNHSLGDQTSAWGMSWFYENVWKYNPSIGIFDFLINDTNSVNSSGIPATIQGPDGTTYNNKITEQDYIANMHRIAKESIMNKIQPIFMGACQHSASGYYVFANALVDSYSEEI